MGEIERWTIHETRGAGLIRPGDYNAVISGRALNEGEEPIEVVRADAYLDALRDFAVWVEGRAVRLDDTALLHRARDVLASLDHPGGR